MPKKYWILLSLFLLVLSTFLVYVNISGYQLIKTQETVYPSGSVSNTYTGWGDYTSNYLHLKIKLPPYFAKYKSFTENIVSGETGKNICVYFSTPSSLIFEKVFAGGVGCSFTNNFIISANSVDFTAGREGGFGDFTGYEKKSNKYYAKYGVNKNIELPSNLVAEYTNNSGVSYLIIKGSNTVDGEWQGATPGTPGEGYIGALVNSTRVSNYSGFAVDMELNSELTDSVFKNIMDSLEFTK